MLLLNRRESAYHLPDIFEVLPARMVFALRRKQQHRIHRSSI